MFIRVLYSTELKKQTSTETKVQKEIDEKLPLPATREAKRPKKTWYTLLFSMHFRLKDSKGAINVLKAALHHYPVEKTFWTQLGAVYAQLEDFQNATAVMSLAYRQNLLDKGSELRYTASNYTYVSVPYKAAEIMEDGMKKGIIENNVRNWRAAAGNWQQAEENAKSAKAYDKAGTLDKTGKYFINEGDVYARMESWRKAAKAYKKAISKGDLKVKDEGRAYLNLGIAQFNTGDYTTAIKTLKKATKFKKKKRVAKQWILFAQAKKNSSS